MVKISQLTAKWLQLVIAADMLLDIQTIRDRTATDILTSPGSVTPTQAVEKIMETPADAAILVAAHEPAGGAEADLWARRKLTDERAAEYERKNPWPTTHTSQRRTNNELLLAVPRGDAQLKERERHELNNFVADVPVHDAARKECRFDLPQYTLFCPSSAPYSSLRTFLPPCLIQCL